MAWQVSLTLMPAIRLQPRSTVVPTSQVRGEHGRHGRHQGHSVEGLLHVGKPPPEMALRSPGDDLRRVADCRPAGLDRVSEPHRRSGIGPRRVEVRRYCQLPEGLWRYRTILARSAAHVHVHGRCGRGGNGSGHGDCTPAVASLQAVSYTHLTLPTISSV